jgi:hypothetical protein
MLELQDILNRHGDDYLSRHPVSQVQKKAIKAIRSCRTAALNGHMEVCDSCGISRNAYNSCGNRNCPKCGNLKKEQWILDRQAELLPVPYFHTVFTVPHELNSLFISNQKLLYSMLQKVAAQTISELAMDKKYLGAKIGIVMILHTWGQNLCFHPHVHLIVPGGGLSSSGLTFVHSKKKFFIPVRVLSKVFRGKCLAFLRKAKQEHLLKFHGDSAVFENTYRFKALLEIIAKKDWIVYCKKPFKQTVRMVEYLSRYTHKTAIYNNRLDSVTDATVSFKWRDYKDKNQVKQMTLSTDEFIRRFLMHVLPSGFQKIRYYGLISCRTRKTKLSQCFRLLKIPIPQKTKLSMKELVQKILGFDVTLCRHCGGVWSGRPLPMPLKS